MDSLEEILAFMDFLDLDEEIIDTRLKSLMARSSHTHKHFTNVIQLLLYKKLINTREATECDNEDEFEFIAKLLGNVNYSNVDQICKIVNIVLTLNTASIVRKSEHLIQQVLSGISFQSETNIENDTSMLISLKICDSILDAAVKNGEKLSLMFVNTPLEYILNCSDEKLKVYFLTTTVPKLFEGVTGYNILDRIWVHITQLNRDGKYEGLKILSSLSDYYLPVSDGNGDCKYLSEIVLKYDFWDLILFGLNSNDTLIRKISIYLSKKAIECIMQSKRNVNIQSKNKSIFSWRATDKDNLKKMWDNFFILIDSLEEKQSNIVLPSLKLFDNINIGEYWINCAYNMGLKHDNTQIKLICLEYRLRTRVNNDTEAFVLLEALNDINLYDNARDYEKLKQGLNNMCKDKESFYVILMTIAKINWSPVPFYHLTDVLSNLSQIFIYENISTVIIDILKVPCNNIAIRKAVHLNVSYFIKKCVTLEWRDLASIHSILQINSFGNEENPIAALTKTIIISKEEKQKFYEDMTETKRTLNFVLTYLCSHANDITIFIDVINEKFKNIHNILNQQYSDKKKCLKDVIFLIDLWNKTYDETDPMKVMLHEFISTQYKDLVLFLINILSSESKLNIKEVIDLFTGINFDLDINKSGENLLQLYKTSIIFLNDYADIDKIVASILIISELIKNPVMNKNYKHEMLGTKTFLKLVTKLKFSDNSNQSVGRFKNVFYEKSSEILYHLIGEDEYFDINEVVEFIENVLECGGYGCLNWVLKITNKITKLLLKENAKFNMLQFINRTWNEIEELKSNNQYTPCIEEFINLITNDAIIGQSVYNNVVLLYCNKIIEYGYVKSYPLYHLIVQLQTKIISDHGHLAFILYEMLLYCPVLRKDERIVYNVTLGALQDPKLRIDREQIVVHFNYEIQYLAVAVLSKIDNVETLEVITTLMMDRIIETFRNKKRYHGHSQLHKVLLLALQHLLILLLKSRNMNSARILSWSFELLVKLPHQTSVRICFEWLIALNFYIEKMFINDQMLEILKSKSVPLLSQFFIIYWLMKHKIATNTYTDEEYNFVLDFLLSNTMGPLFTIRLHAQYLAKILYHMANKPSKHTYIIDIIEKTLAESSNDKNLVKLKSDYFVNEFDIIDHMNPCFIYHLLPKYCDGNNNEKVDEDFIKDVMNQINENLSKNKDDDFNKEWVKRHKKYEDLFQSDINIIDYDMVNESEELSGTIQKKYIPWKNMSNVNVYNIEKKRDSAGDLLVVASLIDKLPNLGGMARTSEVFGVKTYVVDSLRHLQDKQFQGLSVSAERWINVEEVRPGRPLKEYLIKMKSEGYSVVAAEQTSTSCKLHSFKFPKKTLLLLGHEKEGVPCDLLPMMDHCVEIPQQGYVRSLNVHVTAAIFVWEYTRQNIL